MNDYNSTPSFTSRVKHLLRKVKYEINNPLYWSNGEVPNWGDDLNPWLYQKLTSKKPTYCPHKSCKRLLMVGSILSSAGSKDICWGTGILSDLYDGIQLKKAFAVRGPLTRQVLLKNEIECPEIYGDPALLISLFVDAGKVDKRHKVSLIPHYVDNKDGLKFAKEKGYNVIDVSLPIEKYIFEVLSSEVILSSSLHGLICADAFGIPAVRVKFSDKLIGGDFKFKDYCQGAQRPPIQEVNFKLNSKINFSRSAVDFPLLEVQQKLLASFPSQESIVPMLKPQYK